MTRTHEGKQQRDHDALKHWLSNRIIHVFFSFSREKRWMKSLNWWWDKLRIIRMKFDFYFAVREGNTGYAYILQTCHGFLSLRWKLLKLRGSKLAVFQNFSNIEQFGGVSTWLAKPCHVCEKLDMDACFIKRQHPKQTRRGDQV